MSKSIIKTIILLTLLTLISACEPTATDISPTATAVPPSLTALPSTVPPIATPTRIPSTPTTSTAISITTAGQVQLLRTLKGHDNRLYGLDFSSDGRLFGSYSLDGVVQIWDPATWQVIQEFTDPNATGWRLFFLADNAHIATGSGTVWDIAAGEVAHALGRGYRVAFSSDGVWMVDNGGQGGIRLWKIADWQVEREMVTSHTGDHLAFSSDSRLLASSGSDFDVKLLDVTTGQELFTLQGHQNIIHGLAFSPDGRWLASASMDTTVKLWNVQTGQLVHTLQTGGELFDVAISPDGSLVAAALNNKTVELWDVAGGRLVRTLNHDGEVVSVTFSPDGALLASGAYDSKIYLWGIPSSTATQMPTSPGATEATEPHPPESDGSAIAFENLPALERLYAFSGYAIAFHPQEPVIATGELTGKIKTWSLTDGSPLRELTDLHGMVCDLDFSPNGSLLAAAFGDKATVIATTSGKSLATFSGLGQFIQSVAFSPDGALLAIGGSDGIKVLDAVNWTEITVLHGHEGGIFDVDFTPDGNSLIAAG